MIEADDVFLKDLYGDKFLFDIPDFQRPFSWEEEHFAQLVDDIKDALDNGGSSSPPAGALLPWSCDPFGNARNMMMGLASTRLSTDNNG